MPFAARAKNCRSVLDMVIALAQNRFDYEAADALLHEVLLSVL